jgi:stearoyl-CoA desaturase (Delta-9 desaturase)
MAQVATPGISKYVAAANARAWKTERRIAIVVVVVPFLALVSGIVLLWGHGIRPVDLGLLIGGYVLTVIGIGVGFHRLVSHKAFATPHPVRVAFAILGSTAAQGPVLYWAAIHRRHHACADRPGDPHSPYLTDHGDSGGLRGFWHSHTGWLFRPDVTDWVHYVPDLLRDRAMFRVSQMYFWWIALGLLIPGLIGFAVTPTLRGFGLGVLWGGLVRIALGHHTTWSVNSICHMFGSQPYEVQDESRNNLLIALFAFGEGWHNNHHAFPSAAFHGFTWWQIDLSGYLIRMMRLLGLAWDIKMPPAEKILRGAQR